MYTDKVAAVAAATPSLHITTAAMHIYIVIPSTVTVHGARHSHRTIAHSPTENVNAVIDTIDETASNKVRNVSLTR